MLYIPQKQTFYFQERFNKFIYGINTIINCGSWQLVSRSWNKIIIYRISELMVIFDPLQKMRD